MEIKDSGNRREFESGAVRDIQEGKGRCDLLPLDVVQSYLTAANHRQAGEVIRRIANFQATGEVWRLHFALEGFLDMHPWGNPFTMVIEVSKHFEDGAKKYGEHNWQKGIPVHCYIDSAVRHLLKWLRGDDDEPHDRAFCWNILCAIWTCLHLPHLNDYAVKEGTSDD